MKNNTRGFDARVLPWIIGVVILMFCGAACACAILWWKRLVNGACPMKGCDGWKVTCHESRVDDGTNVTRCCSNAPVCDDDDGCEWYETMFVSDEERVFIARCMAWEHERLVQGGLF